jgi:hypothetical protein
MCRGSSAFCMREVVSFCITWPICVRKLRPASVYAGVRCLCRINVIMVLVDSVTKWAHFIPTHTTLNVEGAVRLYLKEVWKHHGLPHVVLSDWGPQFIAEFTCKVYWRLGIKLATSMAYHPQRVLRLSTSLLMGDPDPKSWVYVISKSLLRSEHILPSAQLRSVGQAPEKITSTHFGSKSYRYSQVLMGTCEYPQVLMGTCEYPQVLMGTCEYPQVNTGLTSKLQQVIYYAISTSPSWMFPLTLSLPLLCLLLFLKISSHGIMPGKSHREPSTKAAHVDSLERECRIFETVNLPWEKALSTSVEVACPL